MSLTSNTKDKDWVSVRQAIARLSSSKLGPTSTPTFLGVTTTSLTITGLTDNSLIYPVSGLLTSLGAATNGQLPIGSTGAAPVLATITGTANQIVSTPGAGSITLSTPQDIHTGATPTFAGLIISDAGYIGSVSDNNAIQIAANGEVTFSDVTTGILPTAGDHLATKEYIDLAIGSELDFFLSDNDDAVVADTHIMFEQPTGEAQSTEASAPLSQGPDQLIFTWLSEIGRPEASHAREGVYDLHVHLHKTGTKPVNIYWTLSQVDANGSSNETLIVTSETTAELTTSELAYDIHAVVPLDTTTGATKRLLTRVYADVGATGSDPIVTVTMEGATDSHLTVDVPSSVWQLHGDVLDDLNVLGQVGANSEFLVGTGAGVLAWESGATVIGSLGALAADGSIALAGAWDMGSQILTNINMDTGDINTAIVNTEWDAAFAHVSNDGSDHSFIDQSVLIAASPTFVGMTLSGSLSLGFGDLVSEQNPDAIDAIRLKGTASDVDVVIGDVTGYFSVWNAADNNAVFYVSNVGDTDIAGDLTITNAAIIGANSVVFQPGADSTTFLQVLKQAGGAPVLNVDTSNGRVGIGIADPDRIFVIHGSAADMSVSNTNTAAAASILLQENQVNSGGLIKYGSTHATFTDEMWFKNYTVGGPIIFSANGGGTPHLTLTNTSAVFSATITASNYTAANLLTACATNAGGLDFSAASKTLTVEDTAIVSQDYSSDGVPAFAGLTINSDSQFSAKQCIGGTSFSTQTVVLKLNVRPDVDRAWQFMTGKNTDTEWGNYSLRISSFTGGNTGDFVIAKGAASFRVGSGEALTADATTGYTDHFVVDPSGNVNIIGKYSVDGTQVLSNQAAAIANATDAASVITQLNDLLAKCRTHGIIAT